MPPLVPCRSELQSEAEVPARQLDTDLRSGCGWLSKSGDKFGRPAPCVGVEGRAVEVEVDGGYPTVRRCGLEIAAEPIPGDAGGGVVVEVGFELVGGVAPHGPPDPIDRDGSEELDV